MTPIMRSGLGPTAQRECGGAGQVGPSGNILAVGSDRGTQLWDVASGKPIGHPLTGTAKDAVSVAFSPDGKTLATAGGNGTQCGTLLPASALAAYFLMHPGRSCRWRLAPMAISVRTFRRPYIHLE